MSKAAGPSASPAPRGTSSNPSRLLDRHTDSCGDAFHPYRHLAVRVIDQALRDLTRPAESRTDRESARAFLAGSPMLCHWCEVAEIDPRWLVIHLRKLPASSA